VAVEVGRFKLVDLSMLGKMGVVVVEVLITVLDKMLRAAE
jgi:hypothetical protein